MKLTISLTAVAAALALVACGGGGGGGGGGSSSTSLSGTVAVGAPIKGATVEVFGPQGNRVAQAQTGADGKYQAQIPAGVAGPFVIKATYADESLYTVHAGQGSVANVSHLTDAVTAMLSPTGAADGFVLNASSLTGLNTDQIQQAVGKLQTAVAPAANLISDLPAGANFMNTPFDANGTGIDRLLDAASVNVTSKQVSGGVATNIGLAFNVSQGINQLNATQFVTFDSTDNAAAIQAKLSRVNVNANQLPPSNVGSLYLNLIDRLNACYAVPRNQRVSGDTILSQACKDIFYNADPSLFLDAGFNVRQRFASLFTATGTIQFTPTVSPIIVQDIAASGKALVAAKGQDELGNYSYNRFYVRAYNLNGQQQVLGIEGDQNPFEFYVNAENESRTFPLSSVNLDLVQSQFALIVRVPAALRATATATAAIVEGPSGRFEMAPLTGRDNFRMCRQIPDGEAIPSEVRNRPSCNGVPLLVYASEFVDQQISRPRSVQSPLDFDFIKSDFFVVKDSNNNLFTDSDIERIPNGAAWKATVFFNDGSSQVVYTHNAGRPMTSAELRGADSPMIRAAQFSKLTMAEGSGRAARVVDFTQPTPLTPNQGIPAWNNRNLDPYQRGTDDRSAVWAPVEGGFEFDWTVSNSQIPPFLVFVSGQVVMDPQKQIIDRKDRQPFEDIRRFSVASKSVKVFCSPSDPLSLADKSCVTEPDGSNNPAAYTKDAADNYVYNPGAWMTSTSLLSRDQQQRSIIRGYMWFIPTTNGGELVQAP